MRRSPALPALSALLAFVLPAAAYDPLWVRGGPTNAPADFTARDAKRARDLPVRLYLPAGTKPATVVLFSHGLGGSREGGAYLGRHWAARGYAVVCLQHPGSDDSVWKDIPVAQRAAAMQRAANTQNFLLRVRDVPAVLDQLTEWNGQAGHALHGRLDLSRVGMSGHSFGAITTQAVSGQAAPAGGQVFNEPRIRAAVVLSPSTPARGDAAAAFGGVKLPWLLMTGTKDIARIGGTTLGPADVASRLGVFPALPPGGKYELILHEASHFAFADRPDFGQDAARNPNHHRVILALSTAFWDAFLREDDAAKAWLDGDAPRSVMEKDDQWRRK